MIALYVHIPFCARACDYCYYFKLTGSTHDRRAQFLKAIDLEAARKSAQMFGSQQVETVYLGGGTPTLLTVEELERLGESLHRYFYIASTCEFTIETTPNLCREPALRVAAGFGVNRVSIGVQSLDQTVLEGVNRRSSRGGIEAALIEAIAESRHSGIDNINCDLIAGLPEETEESLLGSVAKLIELNVPHISLYPFQIGLGTPAFTMLMTGHLKMASAPDRRARYQRCIATLLNAGYRRNGIAYFVREPRFSCRHNENVWNGGALIGLGPSAQSFVAGTISANIANLDRYVDNPGQPEFAIVLDRDDMTRRWVYMQLSRRLGFNIDACRQTWGKEGEAIAGDIVAKGRQAGLLEMSGNSIILSELGCIETRRLPKECIEFNNKDYASFLISRFQ